ncbi:ATP-binding cassette domain-containing protein [Paenibacillus senegalensis]|uniref:ATP-binding cassette domain-containing protein n=1 Tax=Paenibacillus senegalensis TaxID=1465766 RepID=UPI0002882AE6|nr:ATP-binding cassette domain-containing protein [Paenibacillus senegalensis]
MQMSSLRLPVIYEQLQVVFSTGTGEYQALHNVGFTLRPGEWLAIVGRNGSGKSTLARVIAGLLNLSAGRILPAAGPACKIRMIGQQPDAQIIGETVYEDLCFGLENDQVDASLMREKAIQALSRVGLDDKIDQPVDQLSGGQKQLLAIASALVVKADLLVFDEATSMLDPTARQRILATVRQLHDNGTTIVWITQNMEELASATRVVALEQGTSVFEGSPQLFFYGQASAGTKKSAPPSHFRRPAPAHNDQHTPVSGPLAVPVSDQIGVQLPYAVQVGRALLAQGVSLQKLPLTIDDLREEVGSCAAQRS